jgi:hypothetical protein
MPIKNSKVKRDYKGVLRRKFFAICNSNNWNGEAVKEKIKEKMNVESFNDLTEEQLEKIINYLERKK